MEADEGADSPPEAGNGTRNSNANWFWSANLEVMKTQLADDRNMTWSHPASDANSATKTEIIFKDVSGSIPWTIPEYFPLAKLVGEKEASLASRSLPEPEAGARKKSRKNIKSDTNGTKNGDNKDNFKVSVVTLIQGTKGEKKLSVQSVWPITILPVKPLPHSTYWTYTPLNLITRDSKELTHLPFIDDHELPDNKRRALEEELVEAYGGWNKFHGDEARTRQLDDTEYYDFVNNFLESHPSFSTQGMALWKALVKEVGGDLYGDSPEGLKARYEDLQSYFKKKPHPNLDDSGLGASPGVGEVKEQAKATFATLFCRRCFIYDCQSHTELDQNDVSHYKKKSAPPQDDSSSDRPSGRLNAQGNPDIAIVDCKYDDCVLFRLGPARLRESAIVKAEWNIRDMLLFKSLWDSMGDQYCLIADTLMTKSCSQVSELCRILKNEEDEGFNSPSASGSQQEPAAAEMYDSLSTSLPRHYPCHHENDVKCSKDNPYCFCGRNGLKCEKYCGCNDKCSNRFRGCRCIATCGNNCPCIIAKRECDPDLCMKCKANEHAPKMPGCGNVSLQRRCYPYKLEVRESNIDEIGFGLFTHDEILKGAFIIEYRGELISHEEADRRGIVYDAKKHTFLFDLNNKYVLDSTRMGNWARFINSSKKPNAIARTLLVSGDHRIGIFACRKIAAGDEIFIDYHDALVNNKPCKPRTTRVVCSKTSSKK